MCDCLLFIKLHAFISLSAGFIKYIFKTNQIFVLWVEHLFEIRRLKKRRSFIRMWTCESYSIEYISYVNQIFVKLLAVYIFQNCIFGLYKNLNKIWLILIKIIHKVSYDSVFLIGWYFMSVLHDNTKIQRWKKSKRLDFTRSLIAVAKSVIIRIYASLFSVNGCLTFV